MMLLSTGESGSASTCFKKAYAPIDIWILYCVRQRNAVSSAVTMAL